MINAIKSLSVLVLFLFVSQYSLADNSLCSNGATHYPINYDTPCNEEPGFGSCWLDRSNTTDSTISPVPNGMVEGAPYIPGLDPNSTSKWAVQCTNNDTVKLGAICDAGMTIYASAYSTPCKPQVVNERVFSCWSQTPIPLDNTADGADHHAPGWRVQCQNGTEPQLTPPTPIPVPANNLETALSWSESWTQQKLLIDFETTRDMSFVLEFIDRATQTINVRDDNSNSFTMLNPVWSTNVPKFRLDKDDNEILRPEYPTNFIDSPVLNPDPSINLHAVEGLYTDEDSTPSVNDSSDPYPNPYYCYDVGLDGRILLPMGKFLYLYAEQPYLFSQAKLDDLLHDAQRPSIQLESVKLFLQQQIQQTLNFHETNTPKPSWNSTKGTYRMHGNCHVNDSRSRRMNAIDSLPFNLTTTLGLIHFMMYKSTEEVGHYDKAVKIAQHLKENIEKPERNGKFLWDYWSLESYPEDISHGETVANFIKLLAEHNVVFQKNDITRLSDTLDEYILPVNKSFGRYHITSNPGFATFTQPQSQIEPGLDLARSIAGWLPHTRSAQRVTNITPYIADHTIYKGEVDKYMGALKRFYTRGVNNYPDHAGRTQADIDATACTRDGQCNSDNCWAGRFCDHLYSNGSTCRRDKECLSGNCDNNDDPTTGYYGACAVKN